MRIRNALLASTAATAAVLLQLGLAAPALAQSAAALTGKVSSAAEPVMEGVVVSAKKDGSTITVSVVTDDKGQFSFPAGRLEPGHYTLGARAVGYDLDGPKTADVTAGQAATADIKLKPTQQPAEPAHQCRMDDEHAGHQRAEVVPAQLQQLPHHRAHRALDPRRRRVRADLRAHGRLLSGQHAAQAAAAGGRRAARGRQQRQIGRRISGQHQPEPARHLELSAQDPAAAHRQVDPRDHHGIRSAESADRAA